MLSRERYLDLSHCNIRSRLPSLRKMSEFGPKSGSGEDAILHRGSD